MGCSNSSRIKETKNLSEKQIANLHTNKYNIQNDIFIIKNSKPIKEVYQFLDCFGSGGFSVVYQGKQKSTSILRAIKEFSKKKIVTQGTSIDLPKEIEILRQLSHPHILKSYEWFEDEENFHLITELIEGGTLLKRIEKMKKFSEIDAAVILQQLLATIHYLHMKGIFHRDIKLENIMLEKTEDISIKLIDFGLADYFDENTKFDMLVGSPFYIAPEVIRQNYNNKCDIWSIGVLMYVLLSGEYPFQAADYRQTFKLIKANKVEFKNVKWTKISNSAKDLVARMLEKDYNKRPTAEQCLQHEWIVDNIKKQKTNNIDTTDLKFNLIRFLSADLLEQAFKSYLIYQFENTQKAKDLRNLFVKIDTNCDGSLSMEEIKAGLSKYFKDPVLEKNIDEIVDKMHFNSSGNIDYDQFLRVFLDMRSIVSEKKLKEAFDYFDIDKSGSISKDELKSMLRLGDDKKELIDKILNDFDKNNDGLISYEEMKHVILNSIS
jgi:calcium-dependent protein kinase